MANIIPILRGIFDREGREISSPYFLICVGKETDKTDKTYFVTR